MQMACKISVVRVELYNKLKSSTVFGNIFKCLEQKWGYNFMPKNLCSNFLHQILGHTSMKTNVRVKFIHIYCSAVNRAYSTIFIDIRLYFVITKKYLKFVFVKK